MTDVNHWNEPPGSDWYHVLLTIAALFAAFYGLKGVLWMIL